MHWIKKQISVRCPSVGLRLCVWNMHTCTYTVLGCFVKLLWRVK